MSEMLINNYSAESAAYDRLVSYFENYDLNGKVNSCPYCGKGIEPVYRISVTDGLDLVAVYKCPSCNKLIVGRYESRECHDDGHIIWDLKEIFPRPNIVKEFPECIKEISPRFCDIYSQCERAYNEGLDEICGVGFRKALEVLIKDYLINDKCKKSKEVLDKLKEDINKLGNEEKDNRLREIGSKNSPIVKYINEKNISVKDVVLKSTLEKCIEYCISDPRIIECAHQARYLGNDETHYERKVDNATIEDLKLLIDLTVNWIETEKLTEKYKGRFLKK